MGKEKDKVIVTGKLGNGAEEGCNTCPKEYPLEFKDILSYKEYKISGTCQKCQYEIFKKELDPKNIGVDGYEYWEDIEKDYKPIKGENKIEIINNIDTQHDIFLKYITDTSIQVYNCNKTKLSNNLPDWIKKCIQDDITTINKPKKKYRTKIYIIKFR